jgi:hypothetical protein
MWIINKCKKNNKLGLKKRFLSTHFKDYKKIDLFKQIDKSIEKKMIHVHYKHSLQGLKMTTKCTTTQVHTKCSPQNELPYA